MTSAGAGRDLRAGDPAGRAANADPGAAGQGSRDLGPVVTNGAMATGPIDDTDQLPRGWISEQDGGRYRLVDGGHDRLL